MAAAILVDRNWDYAETTWAGPVFYKHIASLSRNVYGCMAICPFHSFTHWPTQPATPISQPQSPARPYHNANPVMFLGIHFMLHLPPNHFAFQPIHKCSNLALNPLHIRDPSRTTAPPETCHPCHFLAVSRATTTHDLPRPHTTDSSYPRCRRHFPPDVPHPPPPTPPVVHASPARFDAPTCPRNCLPAPHHALQLHKFPPPERRPTLNYIRIPYAPPAR